MRISVILTGEYIDLWQRNICRIIIFSKKMMSSKFEPPHGANIKLFQTDIEILKGIRLYLTK
jgi:hypothetical protein